MQLHCIEELKLEAHRAANELQRNYGGRFAIEG